MGSTIMRMVCIAGVVAALAQASASAGALDQIRQDKTIRLAVRPDAFSFRDVNDSPAGFMVDLCRPVAAQLTASLAR